MAYINLMDVMYPVGSIYTSVNSTSPATIIGGTWTELNEGAGLTQNADAGSYVGSKTISVDQMPSHTHIPRHSASYDPKMPSDSSNVYTGITNKEWQGIALARSVYSAWAYYENTTKDGQLYIKSTGGGRTTSPTPSVVTSGIAQRSLAFQGGER